MSVEKEPKENPTISGEAVYRAETKDENTKVEGHLKVDTDRKVSAGVKFSEKF